MIKKMKENQKGFTLVELVVVIAILAVLALLIVPRILGNVGDAKKSTALADARTIASEVTTHNALVAIGDAKEEITGSSSITIDNEAVDCLIDTDLGPIKRGDGKTLKNAEIAKVFVVVDEDGNASVYDEDED